MVAFHPGGELLASRGWNSVLRLWDIRTGRQVLSMASTWLPDLHFDRSGTRLSSHAASGRAGILEVSFQTECRTGQPTRTSVERPSGTRRGSERTVCGRL